MLFFLLFFFTSDMRTVFFLILRRNSYIFTRAFHSKTSVMTSLTDYLNEFWFLDKILYGQYAQEHLGLNCHLNHPHISKIENVTSIPIHSLTTTGTHYFGTKRISSPLLRNHSTSLVVRPSPYIQITRYRQINRQKQSESGSLIVCSTHLLQSQHSDSIFFQN